MWPVVTTDVFDEWFSDLEPDAQAEVMTKVRVLQVMGPQLGRPHVDTLNGSRHANMKEIRAKTARQVMRIAFAFNLERTAILLVAGNKQGANQRRFYQQLIEDADRLFDQHLAKLAAKRKKEKE